MKNRLLTLVVSAVALMSGSSALATPINANLNFSFNNFTVTAPQPIVSGSMGLTLDDVTGQVSAVTAVNLEIAGKNYALSDLVVGGFGSTNYITTNVNAWWEILAQTNDFYFSFGNLFGPANELWPTFQYTSQSTLGGYYSQSPTTFSLTRATTPPDDETPGNPGNPPANVPDTGSAASLLGLALIGLAAVRRRVR